MAEHTPPIRPVEPSTRLRSLESPAEIDAWLRERSAAFEALLREQPSSELILDERRAA